jgi:flagellar assembly factor FliW
MEPMSEITIQSDQFGEFTVPSESVISFKEGIPGFPELTGAVLVSAVETDGFEGVEVATAFWWLQSVTHPELTFLCVDPWLVSQEYEVDFDEGVVEAENVEDIMVLTIVSVTEDAMTANLRAPVVLNTAKKLGAQVVLGDPKWAIKTKVVG